MQPQLAHLVGRGSQSQWLRCAPGGGGTAAGGMGRAVVAAGAGLGGLCGVAACCGGLCTAAGAPATAASIIKAVDARESTCLPNACFPLQRLGNLREIIVQALQA